LCHTASKGPWSPAGDKGWLLSATQPATQYMQLRACGLKLRQSTPAGAGAAAGRCWPGWPPAASPKRIGNAHHTGGVRLALLFSKGSLQTVQRQSGAPVAAVCLGLCPQGDNTVLSMATAAVRLLCDHTHGPAAARPLCLAAGRRGLPRATSNSRGWSTRGCGRPRAHSCTEVNSLLGCLVLTFLRHFPRVWCDDFAREHAGGGQEQKR
jgi:hypothetical protein